ncbi:hypothetical protein SAVIM40S_00912 [Streptomyces avidinii]
MLRCQVPPLPPWTQWAAVHTRLERPGRAGSSTAVPEQTLGPSGPSKKTLPTAGALAR